MMEKRSSERGFSILSILVAISISLMTVKAFQKYFLTQHHSYKLVEHKQNLIDLKLMVLNNVDCTNSISGPPPVCDGTMASAVELKNSTGGNVISSPHSRIGSEYLVRAMCSECTSCSNGKKIVVQALKTRKNSTEPSINSLRKTPHKWEEVFKNTPMPCGIP